MKNINAGRDLACIIWLALGIATLLLATTTVLDTRQATQTMAVLTLTFGVLAYWEHGGAQVTAAGLCSAATGAFVGYAGLWWAYWSDRLEPSFLLAITYSYFCLVPAYYIFWWDTRRPPRLDTHNKGVMPAWIGWFGTGLAVFGIALDFLSIGGTAMRGVASTGIVLVALASVFGYRAHAFHRRFLSVLACLLALYFLVLFGGYGRLIVIVLMAAVAVVLSVPLSSRIWKLIPLAGVPAAASFLTLVRSERMGFNVPADSYADSDVSGLSTFAALIESPNSILGLGETFFSSAVSWVPRAIWEEKPFGFGYELTLMFRPELASIGHSMVATVFGEYYYNFQWAGIAVAILTLGPLVRFLDRSWQRIVNNVDTAPAYSAALLALVALASAGTINLVWGGSHTFATRLIIPLGIAAACAIVFKAARFFPQAPPNGHGHETTRHNAKQNRARVRRSGQSR